LAAIVTAHLSKKCNEVSPSSLHCRHKWFVQTVIKVVGCYDKREMLVSAS